MVTEVREEQRLKGLSPIAVTDDGMVTDVREEQRKALRPISVRPAEQSHGRPIG